MINLTSGHLCATGVEAKDNLKLAFVSSHFAADSPFQEKRILNRDVQHALAWTTGKGPEEIIRQREHIIKTLEEVNRQQWQAGICDSWLDKCEHDARDVVQHVNGPMLTELSEAMGYEDIAAIESFRTGAPFYGVLDACSMGERIEYVDPEPMEDTFLDCERSNRELLKQLKTDEHANELLELTRADAELGRMTVPVPIENVQLDGIRLCPRFAVVQGEHDDGKPKIRPVDHFSWSAPAATKRKRIGKKAMKADSVNGHTAIPEKIHYDHIDDFLFVIRAFMELAKVCVQCACRRVDALVNMFVWKSGAARNVESRHKGGLPQNAN